jgi:bifunctional oligoribonuclease and PAP phosphatase NrnA
MSSAPEAYVSSTTLSSLARWLKDCRRIVVVTHLKPDGDAIGSTIGLVRALNLSSTFGPAPRAEAWYAGPLPPWFADIVGSTPHKILTPESPAPPHGDYDAVLIVDTGSRMQLEPIADWIAKRRDAVAIIDHHVQGDADIATLRWIESTAAAACQPAAELSRLLLGVPTISKLPEPVATPLYLGLATDTGWFRHSNVDRPVMTAAGDLIAAGARHTWLYQMVEQRDSAARLRLLARALATLELHDEGRVATMTIRVSDFAETKAQPGESGGFVDYTQGIPSVKVTVLLTEASGAEAGSPNGAVLTKISMRSKPGTGSADVNAVAQEFGGGGHVRAAGARIPLSMQEAKAQVLATIHRHFEKPPAKP